MATPEDILHDLLDALEEERQKTVARLNTLYSRLDPVELADPEATAYTERVANEIEAIVHAGMRASHDLGRRTTDRLAGSRGGSLANPLLDGQLLELSRQVDQNVITLSTKLTNWLEGRRGGLPIGSTQRQIEQFAVETRGILERALVSLTTLEPGPIRLVGELREIRGEVASSALTSSARGGMIEQTVAHVAPRARTVEEIVEASYALPMRWVCALVNTCPDCLTRHNEIDTVTGWSARGLPTTGWSVCGGHCQCMLTAAEFVGTEIEPLARVKETATGLTVRGPSALLDPATGSLERRRMREGALAEAYRGSVEVRRAFREQGRQNAD